MSTITTSYELLACIMNSSKFKRLSNSSGFGGVGPAGGQLDDPAYAGLGGLVDHRALEVDLLGHVAAGEEHSVDAVGHGGQGGPVRRPGSAGEGPEVDVPGL